MVTRTLGNDAGTEHQATDRYLVVSADSHVGPSPERDLRQYCPNEFLAKFDEFAIGARQIERAHAELIAANRSGTTRDTTRRERGFDAWARLKDCQGQHDPNVRLRDMDADGIAVDVIFHGGENDEAMPFGSGIQSNAGPVEIAPELRAVGEHIYNRWLADFVSVAPERLLGVMQVPIWDVDAAVREVEWGREKDLRVVNLPAPRADYPPYTEAVYEPLWSACEALQMTLVSHVGAGEPGLGINSPRGQLLLMAEIKWLSRRGLWQLIFGGVFERHPGLYFVITEEGAEWIPETLRHLDSAYANAMGAGRSDGGVNPGVNILCDPPDNPDTLPKRPSDYWASNCFCGDSFMAPFEVALRHDVGIDNLMWGSDYPHMEGTWPYTKLSMRHTFAGVPEHETRMILGDNGVRAYHLDADALRPVADRIGPTPDELNRPLAPEEFPADRGYAFRELSTFY